MFYFSSKKSSDKGKKKLLSVKTKLKKCKKACPPKNHNIVHTLLHHKNEKERELGVEVVSWKNFSAVKNIDGK